VDDFVAVAGLDGGVGPLRARENFEVAFDGNAAGWEIQVTQQVSYSSALLGFSALSIDGDCLGHLHSFNSTLRLMFVPKLTDCREVGLPAPPRSGDWNALPNAQFETQLTFCWAAGGFNYQGGVRIAQTRHVERDVSFACRC
jgi:hypothetical protein